MPALATHVDVNAFQRFQTFFQGVREEIKLVSWPTREELLGSAVVVFVGVAILAIYISLCDFILSKVASVLLR